jgi:hypothetical protein
MKTGKMKTRINLKTRKMKNNYLKLVMMVAVMLSASIGFAQTTTGDITVGVNAGLGTSGTTVKVIDNKGTVKYLQSNNGITTFTNTTPAGGVVTTWQLGGVLTENTYIDASTKEFGITGITGIDEASAVATDQAATAFAGTGYTLVVRDEGTGELKKVLAADILAEAAITGIIVEYQEALNVALADVDINVNGLQILDASTSAKLSVYRNGVKLRYSTDFTIVSNGATSPTISVRIPIAGAVPLYLADVVEIQYLK